MFLFCLPPVAVLPAHLIDRTTWVGCPYCRASGTVVRDESGVPGPISTVVWWEPPGSGPDSDRLGRLLGWAWVVAHACRPMVTSFRAQEEKQKGVSNGR